MDNKIKNKLNLHTIRNMKKKKIPLAWITSYDLPVSHTAEKAGIDMILVGDSGAMVQLGYNSTNSVTMDEMITLAKSVRRGAANTFVIGDMPQGSYEISDEDAVRNALRFIKESGCDAVKLEGGRRMASKIKAINDAGILAMGHIGLTPQSAGSFGGYRVQCKTLKSFEQNLDDAFALQEAGAFAILLEAMPAEPAGQIASQLEIPVYGIGAGNLVDGQLLIAHDLLGFYDKFRPWFAKCYVPEVVNNFTEIINANNDLKKSGFEERNDGLLLISELAIKKYIEDVKEGIFPDKQYSYELKENELVELLKSDKWNAPLHYSKAANEN
jgi:3-methyl-2-oxobutanoate hydroxymethyltransferase